jgi:endonuclease YncB( thermonuclease family)
MIATAFLCLVTYVYDGDGPLWCQNGLKVRVAGIQAPDFENAEP